MPTVNNIDELDEVIVDYNSEAPDSGLNMMSPLEYKELIKLGV